MRKHIFTTIVLLGFVVVNGCNKIDEFAIEKQKKVWVYIEMLKVSLPDTTTFYYYGKVNNGLIEKIDEENLSKGLFLLSEIRFINNNDLLQIFENDEDFGFKIFRVENIQYIAAYKKDPIYFYPVDELHESARKLKMK